MRFLVVFFWIMVIKLIRISVMINLLTLLTNRKNRKSSAWIRNNLKTFVFMNNRSTNFLVSIKWNVFIINRISQHVEDLQRTWFRKKNYDVCIIHRRIPLLEMRKLELKYIRKYFLLIISLFAKTFYDNESRIRYRSFIMYKWIIFLIFKLGGNLWNGSTEHTKEIFFFQMTYL